MIMQVFDEDDPQSYKTHHVSPVLQKILLSAYSHRNKTVPLVVSCQVVRPSLFVGQLSPNSQAPGFAAQRR